MGKYQRIKDLREDLDLSQEALATELGMYKTQYQRYESGERRVPFDFAIELAEYHKVSLDYIAGRTNDKKGLTRSELSESETEIIKIFRSLSDERKGMIKERMNILAEEQEEERAKLRGAG